jgi:hypothetical protein
MDMSARDQYLTQLRSDYIGADKQTKTRLLNEAEQRTKLARKYLIAKLRPDAAPRPSKPKRRRALYGPAVKTALAQLWPIFDYPCGQRFAPILRMEVDRLRALGEIHVSDTVAAKLKTVSPKTVDRLLRGERQRLQLNRYRNPAIHPLLYQQIPVKVPSEWDREQIGNLQVDFVLHCGQSSAGLFAVTLSAADIASGWWEASAMLGRSQHGTHMALEAMCERLPFSMHEIHPDNDSCLVNELVYNWCRKHHITMSRSRPLQKNDNAWVEQRNWTHVRKIVGYRRFDTQTQLDLLNDVYAQLALYKNFFQPTTKLVQKWRVKGKLHRVYETPKTPYQRLLESGQLSVTACERLNMIYRSLNPAELKRRIDQHRDRLFATFENTGPQRRPPTRKMTPRLVRSFMTQQATSR